MRIPVVTWCAPEQQHWVVQPLIDAGLAMDQIRSLVFRLAFDEIVGDGRATVAGIHDIVRDQPARVQAAWAETVGRMLALPDA
jgi:hypothetical protein